MNDGRDDRVNETAPQHVAPRRWLFVAFAAAASVTAAAAGVERGLAPERGVIRTVYVSGRFDSPRTTSERVDNVTFASLPPRQPGAPLLALQWRTFWYIDSDRNVEMRIVTEDDAELWIDGRPVLRQSPGAAAADPVRLRLAAGAHEVVIRYRQHGRRATLAALWNAPGDGPAALPIDALYVERVGRLQVVGGGLVPWLRGLAAAAWIVTVALVLAGVVSRRRRGSPLAVAAPGTFARRLLSIAGPALVGPLLIFLVGPHLVYTANPAEFEVPFRALAWPWLVGAVALSWAALMAVGAVASLLSDWLTRAWASVLLVVGLLIWIQATLLVPDVGPLFGERLNLAIHDWRTWYEGLFWAGALLAALVFAAPLSRLAAFVSVTFALVQLSTIVLSSLSTPSAAETSDSPWTTPPPELYALSQSKNVVHIVLDAFLSEMFDDALGAEREWFDRTYSGFVYFPEHLGAFPTTRASMPAMLAGAVYRNDEPFEDFLRRTVLRRSVASVLAESGYDVRSITFHAREHQAVSGKPPSVVRYTIPTPFGGYDDYVRFTAFQLFDLSLFRSVPQPLKHRVYNDDRWLFQGGYVQGGLDVPAARTVRSSNHAAFLTDMTRRIGAAGSAPVYMFLHVALPHPPLVLDEECGFVDRRSVERRAYVAQSRCALRLVGSLLERMRALGIYDRSAIVLTADHGWRLPRRGHPLAGTPTPAGDLQDVALTAMPLLAVKPFGASGPVRVSRAPTTITDIPATIARLTGLPGETFPGPGVLDIDEHSSRARSFAFHTWRDTDWKKEYFDALYVFSVNGPIRQPRSWTFSEKR